VAILGQYETQLLQFISRFLRGQATCFGHTLQFPSIKNLASQTWFMIYVFANCSHEFHTHPRPADASPIVVNRQLLERYKKTAANERSKGRRKWASKFN
jgi:hypothetical protein